MPSSRPLLGVLVIVAALLGGPAPASADVDPEVWLDSDFGASALALGAVKEVPVWYRATAVGGAPMPRMVRARIDASAAPSVAITLARPTPGCSRAGAVITCERAPSPAYSPDGDARLRLVAARGAKSGDVGTVAITVTAEGGQTSVRQFSLTVTAPGPDLGVSGQLGSGAAGSTVTARPAIRNSGDRVAKTVLLYMTTGSYAEFPDRFRNCHYKRDDYGFDHAVCLLENVRLAPGETLTFGAATPLRLKIRGNALGRYRINRYDPPGQPFLTYASYRVDSFDAKPVDERLAWPLGTGPALTFQRVAAVRAATAAAAPAPAPNDVDPRNDYATFLVTVAPNNPTDMAATGASIRGRVGAVVSLKVAVTNQGPAAVWATPEGKGGDPADPYNAGFRLAVPPTVEVVDVVQPPGYPYQNWYAETTPAGVSYLVLPFSLADHARYEVEFTVRITAARPSTGTITAQGGVLDPDHADDTATIWVNRPAH